jgi:hypothetical protein
VKRIILGLLVALVAVAVPSVAVGTGQTPAATKVNICHFTGKKYVALTVSQSALATHVQHHQDVLGTSIVPQGTTKQKKAAARAFCAGLSVLTPTRGGKPASANLTSTTTGLTGSLNLRARLGQGQLCISLTVNSTTTPITLSGITVINGTTTVATLNLSTLGSLTSATSPLKVSGCVDVSRALVKQILQTSGLTLRVTTSSPSGGVLTGTLS